MRGRSDVKVYHTLYSDKTFWGFVKVKGGGWRFGFGRGFFEWVKNSVPGIYLPMQAPDESEWTLIVRHCAPKEMYDDEGYCETKIRKRGEYYWFGVADGNGANFCSECALQAIIYQLQMGGKFPEYRDCWMQDFELMRKAGKEALEV